MTDISKKLRQRYCDEGIKAANWGILLDAANQIDSFVCLHKKAVSILQNTLDFIENNTKILEETKTKIQAFVLEKEQEIQKLNSIINSLNEQLKKIKNL